MSLVICHMPNVTCNMSQKNVIFLFLVKLVELVGGGSVFNGSYLPLVYIFNRPGVAGVVIKTPLFLINRPGVAGAVL